MKRADVLKFVKKKYNTEPEYLWEDYPDVAVLRHINGRKWYGIIMNPLKSNLGIEGDGRIDVIDLKCDPIWVSELKERDGAYPAYHMNKTHWITIALDECFPDEDLKDLIEHSYQLTAPKKKRLSQ